MNGTHSLMQGIKYKVDTIADTLRYNVDDPINVTNEFVYFQIGIDSKIRKECNTFVDSIVDKLRFRFGVAYEEDESTKDLVRSSNGVYLLIPMTNNKELIKEYGSYADMLVRDYFAKYGFTEEKRNELIRQVLSNRYHLSTVDNLEQCFWFYRMIKYVTIESMAGYNETIKHILKLKES